MSAMSLAVDSTEEYFNRMVQESGIDSRQNTILRIWDVFKRFASVSVKSCPHLELLVQWGIHLSPEGVGMYQLSFVRQFNIEENGEYGGMQQLDCRFYYTPNDELRRLEGNLWSMDYDNVELFFNAVEQCPGFALPIGNYTPTRFQITQEWI